MKEPDRLYIAEKNRELIMLMEEKNFLNANNLTRKEIFLYAMSLGLNNPTPIEGKSDGLFLAKDLSPSDKSMLYGCYLSFIREIEALSNITNVFKYAEECTNTGFMVIKDYIKQDDDHGIEILLNDLDLKFDAIKNLQT